MVTGHSTVTHVEQEERDVITVDIVTVTTAGRLLLR